MKLFNNTPNRIGLFILIILGIGLTAFDCIAGPAVSSGLDFKKVSKQVCNRVSKNILSGLYSFDSIEDTSQGNVIAESNNLTVLVMCYDQEAIGISAASDSRELVSDLVHQYRILLNQHL